MGQFGGEAGAGALGELGGTDQLGQQVLLAGVADDMQAGALLADSAAQVADQQGGSCAVKGPRWVCRRGIDR